MARSDDAEDPAMTDDALDAELDSKGSGPVVTDEARELAVDFARAMFIAIQKIDGGDSVDQRSAEFKEKWTAERPRLLKISRFALRRLYGKGYRFSSEKPDA